jgi:hypothetical protein
MKIGAMIELSCLRELMAREGDVWFSTASAATHEAFDTSPQRKDQWKRIGLDPERKYPLSQIIEKMEAYVGKE